ncbi:MAG: multifunctional oxoglutarate decarboxylase/oxoglutarate dehydrogenase thiamine pyrophosphate-binding subunit/dihydrolipoyllysine-residue succinyltransferase subunit [Actinomycetota bacterium]
MSEGPNPNDWLVDEMYRQFLEDPSSVSEAWQEFFEDYKPRGEATTADESGRGGLGGRRALRPAPDRDEQLPEDKREARETSPSNGQEAVALKGAAAAIVRNMEASLGVPTATSVRTMPAKLLEENRRVINDYLSRGRGGKVSFTHLIGWAIVRALQSVPALNSSYQEVDGKPHVVRHKAINLGLAVDMQRKDGSRTLLVPNIRAADALDFAGYHVAYEEVIRKVRSGKIGPEDFEHTTVTLTNPGMIGTVLSVPRLMAGQGAIIGAGSIDYPTEYKGTDPATLAALGIGKVVTLTSTYDHRIIQGAESGEFLDNVESLLTGQERFYDEIFAALDIPYEPIRWTTDTGGLPGVGGDPAAMKASRVLQLINMYRVRGHLIADLNPLVREARRHLELDPAYYGLGVWDLDRVFHTDGFAGKQLSSLREILDILRSTYCGTVGIEFMHIQEADEKRWIQERVEGVGVDRDLSREKKLRLLNRLNASEAFERFLHTKYVGHKRFSLEGAESLIPMLHTLLDAAAGNGMKEAVMGMAHRGRLNVLTNVVGKSYVDVFHGFEGDLDPRTTQGSGDVMYHVGAEGTHSSPDGTEINVSVASNPSHLEAVNPVVEGMTKAKQHRLGHGGREEVLPVLIHGDAAFAGQGVVQETLNLSQLRGYRTGGTVHIVVNNSIGFTAGPESTRSSVYATDVAKMIQAPIFHVNGDDPEACIWVIDLAFAFRQAFHKDVVVDLQCYRRWGHNEADEPGFTQPLMYTRIDEHRSVRKLYTEALVNRGDITLDEAEKALEDFRAKLEQALEETRAAAPPTKVKAPPPQPPKGVRPHLTTGVSMDVLERVIEALRSSPDGFEAHPKLQKIRERQLDGFASDQIDWALAEALSWGSLLIEGRKVRLAGQDSRRGTFSQRHSALIDHRSGEECVPLRALESEAGGRFLIYDSLLSEYAAVGFEYGYSVADPEALVMWEAQFGDFVNGAQIVVDNYLVASEDKWWQTSGLVLLLPHGYEGQGPEHSSARIERFLTAAAEDNIQVAYPTLPAQYFHLLRRQVYMAMRKPLIIFTPKSLLRHPRARSVRDDLMNGSFEEVLVDPAEPTPEGVRRILLCTGKIAVDLMARRDELKVTNVAIVRVEQLYPFPHAAIDAELSRYQSAEKYWVQEEPENMGAWTFAFARLQHQCDDIQLVSRPESGSPATGSKTIHAQEQEEILEEAFEGLS